LAAVTTGKAQLLLGGSYGLNYAKTNTPGATIDKETQLDYLIVPRIGVQKGAWWFGADLGIQGASEKDRNTVVNSEITSRELAFQIGPFVRYVWRPTEFMGLWMEGQINGGFGSQYSNGDKFASIGAFNSQIRPGVLFFVGKHLIMEASFGQLGFQSSSVKLENNSNDKLTESEFGFNLNPVTFQMGVNWLFGSSANTQNSGK
jgi:hypothetical protein